MKKNEIKNVIANLNVNATENAPEYSEELSVAVGLNDPETDGGVIYYFKNGEPVIVIDTYETNPPKFTADEFIKAYESVTRKAA